MKLPPIKLEYKLLFLFIFVSIAPLIINNVIWFSITKTQMTTVASTTVKQAANTAENTINDFFRTKLIGLIIHSQTEAVRTKNVSDATLELHDYLAQDNDLQEFLILDTLGHEILHVTRTKTYKTTELGSEQTDPAFKVPTFGGGAKYTSPVYKDRYGNLLITISIPIIISHDLPNLQNLNTSAIGALRTTGEITGVLVMKTKLDSLWETLRRIKINNNGYVFVIDSEGKLLFHPEKNPLGIYPQISATAEVTAFLSDSPSDTSSKEQVRQSINDKGQQSLSTHSHIDLTKWGVIAQVPVSDVLGSILQIQIFGIILFAVTLIFTITLSLEFSRNIITPIKKLGIGAHNFGRGNFSYRIHVRTNDELENLAYAFNSMAINLQQAFEKLSIDKNIITAERNKLNFVLLNINDAIVALDKKRNIVIFNKVAEHMTGFSAEEVIGKPIDNVIDIYEEDIPLTIVNYAPIYDTEKNVYTQDEIISKRKVELLSKHGNKLFIKFSSVVLKRTYNHTLGFILTFHDITEELNLEKMKMDFVSIAAHELRTPLTVIKGYLSVLKDESNNILNDEQKLFLIRIQRGTEQLTFLIENLLNVARIEKGTLTLKLDTTDWIQLAKQIISDLKNQAADKKIALTFHEPPQHISQVKVDVMRIREVLTNLIVNAINYTPEGGKIEIIVEQKNNEVITHVSDTGIGIPKSSMANLFTKFYRVSSVLTAGSKGTGLGLYIAKSIVELHKGKIWVESTEKQGSTFSFTLPIESIS